MAGPSDLAHIQAFYSSVGYGGGIHPGDRVLVARADQSILAVVRLCSESGTLVLRGMYVAEEKRGQGIGARLLESASAEIGSSECWCIPYSHLTDFYSRAGFRVCEEGGIPRFLDERRARYTSSGMMVVVMKRPKP